MREPVQRLMAPSEMPWRPAVGRRRRPVDDRSEVLNPYLPA